MPSRANVKSLQFIVVNFVAETIHKYAKVCSKWARQRKKVLVKNKNERLLKDVEEKLRDCHKLFAEIGVCIYHSSSNLEELFQSRIRQLILAETGLLDETYYLAIGKATFNESLRIISLDKPRLFQDSSFALETFLFFGENDSSTGSQDDSRGVSCGLNVAKRLREFILTKSVCELIDFDFEPTILNLGGPSFPKLNKIVMQGLNEIGISRQIIIRFVRLLLHKYQGSSVTNLYIEGDNDFTNIHTKNDSISHVKDIEIVNPSRCHLSFLDLSNSSLDDECCQILSQIKTIGIVLLNNCANVTTVGILDLLENLKSLDRIEANKGQNSSVQQAFTILESDDLHNNELELHGITEKSSKVTSFPQMKTFMLRNPRSGIDIVGKFCPNLTKLRIIYNVYEYPYDARLDDCLIELISFNQFQQNLGSFEVHLDLNCMNMLFVIQLRDLVKYGKAITSITLTEPEFVHPQTLNPLALNCPRLESLTLVNPSTISDNLFVGEVPELASNPFKNLRDLFFEGETLSVQLAKFLFKSSVQHLEKISLAVEEYTSDIKEILGLLISYPRPRLKTLTLYFGTFGPTTDRNACEDMPSECELFADCVAEVVDVSPILKKFDLFVKRSHEKGLDKVVHSKLLEKQMNCNWDIDFRIVIK